MDDIKTGGGASVGGDADTGGGDFAGRDRINVNVNVGRDEKKRGSRPTIPLRKTGLSMAEANVLWQSINQLSEAVGGLKASIEANSKETGKLANAVEDQSDKFQVIDKAISTLQTGLAELGLTPVNQREPKWKTNLLISSSVVIALCALIGLWFLMFGGG